MVYGKTYLTWTMRTLAVFSLSIAASGCATEDGANVVNGGKGMQKTCEPKLPKEVQTIRGVDVQLTAEQKTWDAGETPLLDATVIVDEKADDDVYLATHVGLGCRVNIDGRWYTHLVVEITGVAYQKIRKVNMTLDVRLDKGWESMNGGEVLSLSKGSHRVQFAWAGYREVGSDRQPLLLLSNEVEIVVNGK